MVARVVETAKTIKGRGIVPHGGGHITQSHHQETSNAKDIIVNTIKVSVIVPHGGNHIMQFRRQETLNAAVIIAIIDYMMMMEMSLQYEN